MKNLSTIGAGIALTGLVLSVIGWIANGQWGGPLTSLGTIILVIGALVTLMTQIRQRAQRKAQAEEQGGVEGGDSHD